jgi:bifunctional non-homologous end joining protein LigD
MPDKLSAYQAKRNFHLTPEPRGEIVLPADRLRFVVQKHDARKLHYDFRLELDGTLKSWAVPKGPSLDPSEKRLAVQVEDHPLDYIDFEGDIPEHQYGAGHVDVWDIGFWEPQGDPSAGYRAGKLKFHLDGEKLQGGWTLVRTRLRGNAGKEQWLLIKEKDEEARPHDAYDITAELPDSVLSPASKAEEAKAMQGLPAAAENTGKPAGRGASASGKAVKKTPSGKAADAPMQSPSAPQPMQEKTAPKNIRLHAAVKRPIPEMLSPQLATLVDETPQTGDWLYEIKYDGYRVLARVEGDDVRIFTRDGKDWTARLPGQRAAIAALGLESAWIDGEIVVLDKQGVPSFQLLQNAFDEKRAAQIAFFAFDLPYLNGYDLRQTPLSARRVLLGEILAGVEEGTLRLSAQIDQPPGKLLDSACALSMEGIMGKRLDSPYTGKRSADWIKLKCRRRQEFVIAGYTEPQGIRKFFGALLLGVYDDDGKLRYAGRVGTGFDRATLEAIHRQLKAQAQERSPFDARPPGVPRTTTHWVRPRLVAEVSFAEWTNGGLVRQAVFHGMREDKPAGQIRREEAVSMPQNGKKAAPSRATSAAQVQSVRISHPDRAIDPAGGLTKLDLVRYYEAIAPRILPYLANRPVYLLRVPEDIGGEKFFQKHSGRMPIPHIRVLDPALDPEHAPLMAIDSAPALIGAAQMGAVELHTCNATADRIDRPDCMVFDLDPDPALPWPRVVEGARLTRVVLDELGLASFLKTSGGKGLHLVVPIARRHGWEDVEAFSEAVASHLARTIPQLFSAKMGEKNRVGKIFVDYMRNRRHSSAVVPYSARARPGLPVAVPIAWDELDDVTSAAMWTIASLPERLAGLAQDPWAAYFKTRQTITAAMKKKIGIA